MLAKGIIIGEELPELNRDLGITPEKLTSRLERARVAPVHGVEPCRDC